MHQQPIRATASAKNAMRSPDKFKAADAAYQSNQGVKHFVGHSQGGAVALEMGKKYPGMTGRVYGTP